MCVFNEFVVFIVKVVSGLAHSMLQLHIHIHKISSSTMLQYILPRRLDKKIETERKEKNK